MTQSNELDAVFGGGSNPELDSVFGQINSDPTVSDIGNNTPDEVNEKELQSISIDLREEEANRKTIYTNECYPEFLLAKGVNTAAWVAGKHGTLEVDNSKGDVPAKYQGQKLPVKISKEPSKPWDGYRMSTPDGPEDVRKSEILSWMLNKTLGRTLGHESKRLRVHKDKNIGPTSTAKPLTVKKFGLSASNPAHVMDTFEEIPGETVKRTVPLQATDVADGETVPKLYGVVTDFPKFKRKQEFEKSLGLFGSGSSKSKNNPIPLGGVDQKDEIKDWLQLMSIARQHNLID